MLDTLWPMPEPLDAEHAEQILRIAVMDQTQLRALLVENRPLPVQLRSTLRRFEAHGRIEAFFDHRSPAPRARRRSRHGAMPDLNCRR